MSRSNYDSSDESMEPLVDIDSTRGQEELVEIKPGILLVTY